MSELEEVKVLLTKKQGCHFNDRIYLPIYPALLETVAQIFKERALSQESYWTMSAAKEEADFFINAVEQYKNYRDVFDKREEKKEKTK